MQGCPEGAALAFGAGRLPHLGKGANLPPHRGVTALDQIADPATITPRDILDFWFPDGPAPDPARHVALWSWRMRGGANAEILARFTEVTEAAAAGRYDHWAQTTVGRLALIILTDQFPRTVWAGTPWAYAQDPRALALCLEGLANGDFAALENVWQKATFKLPLEHCEGPDHLANLDLAVKIAGHLQLEAPDCLAEIYAYGIRQVDLHRKVIARFGRHPHRNAVLGRTSTAEEAAYIEAGDFPHQTAIAMPGT